MILDHFPKIRQPLPEAYQKIYLDHYLTNRNRSTKATTISGRLEEWMHRGVRSARKLNEGESILEIGAGSLNHLPYETGYAVYDVVEPFKELYEGAPNLNRVSHLYDYMEDVPAASKYDRILSIAVLEHLCELPEIVALACLHLKEKGVFTAGIPSEGQFLWKLAYTVSTGVEFKRRYGLAYPVMMNYEHVNTANEIGAVLQYFFKNARRKLFGLTKGLSLYQVWTCSDPDMEKVHHYLNSKK